MSALTLGLIAAVCWGFHDICVRFLSQKTPISACMFTVLAVGLLFHTGLMSVQHEFSWVTGSAFWLSVGAGAAFVLATLGLYAAFQRGPVRLVAPLIASYPILSVGWAAVSGTPVPLLEWGAVLLIVIGVGTVAALSDTHEDQSPPKGRTAAYALAAALGFALTFALGQEAAVLAGEAPTTLVTRVTAVVLMGAVVLAVRQPFWPGLRALPFLIAMGIADGIALLAVLSAGNLPNPEYAAVASSMFGLLTIVMAWILLRERMSLPQWAGCIVAFTGVGYLAL